MTTAINNPASVIRSRGRGKGGRGYIIFAISLSVHGGHHVGQVVVGLDAGKEGVLGRYRGCLDLAAAQVVAGGIQGGGSLLQGGHQAVEAGPDALLGRDGKPTLARPQPVSNKAYRQQILGQQELNSRKAALLRKVSTAR